MSLMRRRVTPLSGGRRNLASDVFPSSLASTTPASVSSSYPSSLSVQPHATSGAGAASDDGGSDRQAVSGAGEGAQDSLLHLTERIVVSQHPHESPDGVGHAIFDAIRRRSVPLCLYVASV